MSPSPPPPRPPCSPQVSSSLHPSSSCLIKAPHKGVGQINWQPSQPLCWHELDSTLINGNGSAVTRPLVVTLVFVFVTAPHGRTDLVWMQRCLFNVKHSWTQSKCHIIDLVTPHESPSSPSHFILPSFSLCFTQSWPFLQWQLWEVILPLLLHLFPPFFSNFCHFITLSPASPLPSPFSVLHSVTSWWNWLAGVRWYQCKA